MEHISEPPKYAHEGQSDFSFHSFVTLPDEINPDEYHGMNGWKDGEKLGDSAYNWYNWNNANWNTKWDASDVSVHTLTNAVGRPVNISITFSTAWAAPDPVFEEMSRQFPALTFDVHWEEEQGFGAEVQVIAGNPVLIDAWDIPNCHADHEKRGSECICAYYDNPNDWYDDCPREEPTTFVVESITKYIIKAYSQLEAIAAAQAEDAGNDAVQNVEILDVLYSDEYRAMEKEQDNGTTEPTE
jgi:hypothetical protein